MLVVAGQWSNGDYKIQVPDDIDITYIYTIKQRESIFEYDDMD